MKSVFALGTFVLCAGNLLAQLNPLPPSAASVDGIPTQPAGLNAGTDHWENPNGLGAYRFASDGPLDRPNMASPDNVLGLNWSSTPPAAVRREMTYTGGLTVRVIFVGESAGWLNDFGYSYDGNPASTVNSFTLFANISALAPTASIAFGDHADIPLLPGEASTFELWFNAVGGDDHPNPPTEYGSVYTLFHPEHSNPFVAPGNVLWSQSPIMVSTWIPALHTYQDIPTYLVGVEDWRRDRGSDNDYNDFMIAIQFFEASGGVFQTSLPPSSFSVPKIAFSRRSAHALFQRSPQDVAPPARQRG